MRHRVAPHMLSFQHSECTVYVFSARIHSEIYTGIQISTLIDSDVFFVSSVGREQ